MALETGYVRQMGNMTGFVLFGKESDKEVQQELTFFCRGSTMHRVFRFLPIKRMATVMNGTKISFDC